MDVRTHSQNRGALLLLAILPLLFLIGACSSQEKTSLATASDSSSTSTVFTADASGTVVQWDKAETPTVSDATVTNPKLAPDATTADKELDDDVRTIEIKQDAVTTAKIVEKKEAEENSKATPSIVVDGSPTTWGQVVEGDLSATGLIQSGSAVWVEGGTSNSLHVAGETSSGYRIRGEREIERNLTIQTIDIANGAVTTPKIADAAVTTPKIADNAVSSTTGAWSIEISKTGSNEGEFRGMVSNAGADKTNNGGYEYVNETILAEDIATGAVTTDEILNGTIITEDIGSSQITNPLIAPNGDVGVNNQENQNTPEPEIVEVQQSLEPEPLYENAFRGTASSPYSTFSIDVDNASYSNVRGYITRGQLPPADAVRIEELINYFNYDYEKPTGEHPFAFHSEVTDCPWNSDHQLLRLALQGEELHKEQAPPSNLVFLVDVSGSMGSSNKLPLLKQGFLKLVDHLRAEDRVAIVVYAGAAGLVLKSTSGSMKSEIKNALNGLKSGGSTAGGAGIELAYKVAKENFLPNGNNRVILATDGDFNVGVSSNGGLVKLIEEKRKDGVFLSVLGFGTGNYQDKKMEGLADNGNGNYYYIDKLAEAERVLGTELSGTLHAIAKDVKLQIKFNPEKVQAYRLIGYENRVLAAKDFDDDTKDAGELGAGHRVTALYEIVLVGANVGYDVDQSKGEDYQLDEGRPELLTANDLLLARLRYKEPKDSVSKLIEHIVPNEPVAVKKATEETRFAVAVAAWGMLLRGSAYAGTASYDDVLTLAKRSVGKDSDGYRKEFIDLVQKSKELAKNTGLAGTR